MKDQYCTYCGKKMRVVMMWQETRYNKDTGAPIVMDCTTYQCEDYRPFEVVGKESNCHDREVLKELVKAPIHD